SGGRHRGIGGSVCAGVCRGGPHPSPQQVERSDQNRLRVSRDEGDGAQKTALQGSEGPAQTGSAAKAVSILRGKECEAEEAGAAEVRKRAAVKDGAGPRRAGIFLVRCCRFRGGERRLGYIGAVRVNSHGRRRKRGP